MIFSISLIDVSCIYETKLNSPYPDPQLKVSGYQNPQYRKDRNKCGGGKNAFLTEGLITRRISNFEGDTTGTIFLELTLSQKIWFIVFAYRHRINNNKDIFSMNSQII